MKYKRNAVPVFYYSFPGVNSLNSATKLIFEIGKTTIPISSEAFQVAHRGKQGDDCLAADHFKVDEIEICVGSLSKYGNRKYVKLCAIMRDANLVMHI